MPEPVAELLINQLSVPQRLELISKLWDSIPDETETDAIPAWHREELERRLQSADANPDAAIPWEEVLGDLRKQP